MKKRFVGVIGAGRSGLAAAHFLRRQGKAVLLSDSSAKATKKLRGIELETGGHSDRLLEAEFLIRSPGVPNHLPVLQKALRRKIPIWSELEYASRFVHPRRLVAITGTNGKTTTTTLVGELFKATGHPTLIGGNIGTPLSDLVSRVTRRSTLVLEVSSYQLENIQTFHPAISAILNITPDHLEHHGSIAAYAAAKARIFERQTRRDVCVLNADDAWCRRLARRCPAKLFYFSRTRKLKEGLWFEKGEGSGRGIIEVRWGTFRARFPLQWNLPGPHNVENALASIAIALAGGVPLSTIQRVLTRFRGVEHRLEPVRVLDGVRYVNDSKATNVDSTRVALASFREPLWLIMGGQGKGSPYTPLKSLVKEHVRGLLLIGEDAPRIRQELGSVVRWEDCGTLAKAVARGRTLASPGEIVLLSPACASFDQYKNYEERGRDFKTQVRRLS